MCRKRKTKATEQKGYECHRTHKTIAHNFDVGTDAEYMGQKRYFTNNMMPEHKELVRPEPARYRLDDDVPLGYVLHETKRMC